MLAKDDGKRDRLGTVLATAYHGLGTLAVLLSPVLPKATAEAVDRARRRAAPCEEQRIDRAYEWADGLAHRAPSSRCSRASRWPSDGPVAAVDSSGGPT